MFRSISSQACLFRSVTFFVQAELLLCKNTIAVRPLCSTGITLRQRSYGPLRLPPPQINALLIPRHPCSLLTSNSLLRGGSPRYSDYSVDMRSLQSPRPLQYLHMFVAPVLIIGFTISGRLASGRLCNEAETSSLHQGSHLRRQEVPASFAPAKAIPQRFACFVAATRRRATN